MALLPVNVAADWKSALRPAITDRLHRPLVFSRPSSNGRFNIEPVSDVTRILEAAQQGDPKAADQLLPLVYEELRRLAAHKMANEAPGQTLQPTALVHEVWLRLVGQEQQQWAGRTHFFAAAGEAMRRILIERA